MWKLIRVQSLNYLRYLIPLGIFLIFYFREFYQGGKLPVFVFLCFWAFLLVSGSLTTSESYEEKNNGYEILGILPVTNKEIVSSKFILVLGTVMLVTGLNIFLLILRTKSPEKLNMMIMIGLLWGVVCLLYGAQMYIGIFKFGYNRMTKYFWFFFLIILVLLIFFLGDFIFPGLNINKQAVIKFADSRIWLFLVPAGGVLYCYLYKIAVRVKETSEEV
ncbi:MAG: ABC-2 transporter permease [Candidatus Aminicenantes bacterium]|nr:ABC-2 transporter permease [Candidatus Aminicenantes bacterium]